MEKNLKGSLKMGLVGLSVGRGLYAGGGGGLISGEIRYVIGHLWHDILMNLGSSWQTCIRTWLSEIQQSDWSVAVV